MADLACRSTVLHGLQDPDYCNQPVCLTTGQIVGLSFTAQAGFISATAVLILLVIVAFKYRKSVRDPINPSWRLIRTNMDGLMLNLLVADLVMSLGAILGVKWANEGKTYCGTYCNAQGAIQTLGETAVALFTLAITLLSFVSIIRGRAVKYRLSLWGGVSAAIWLFVLLWAVLGYTMHAGGAAEDSFYTPTPYWCWIGKKYPAQRLAGEYIWLWLAGFGSILLYTPLFLVLRGNITWDPEFGWRSIRWRWRISGSSSRSKASFVNPKDRESIMSTKTSGMSPVTILCYPLAYTIIVLPATIVRWITFNDEGDSTVAVVTATFVAVFIFNLSGLVNVVLILFTRTNVLLLGSHSTSDRGGANLSMHGRSANGVADTIDHERASQHVEDLPISALHDDMSDQAKAETGFGGPRVVLRDEDSDFDDGRMNRNGAQASSFFAPSPAMEPLVLPRAQVQAVGVPGAAYSQAEGESKAPGRAYLESLGFVQRT